MKALIYRPLAVFSVAFYIFSCFLFTADTSVRLWSAVFSIALFVISVALRILRRKGKHPILRFLSFLLAGLCLSSFISFHIFDCYLANIEELDGRTCTIEGTVNEIVYDSPYTVIYLIELSKINAAEADFSITLQAKSGFKVRDIIKGDATLYKFENTDDFPQRTQNINNGIFLSGESENIELTGRADGDISFYAGELNTSLCEMLISDLGEREGGFASALLLGNKAFLAPEIKRDFTRLGLSHILALSGMHLTVICAAVSFLLRSFSANTRRISCIIIVLFYMLITGFSPSVTRAGLMLIILTLGAFSKRGSDAFTNLGLSVLVINLADPFSAADIGLLLSFACVFAILLYNPKKKELVLESKDLKSQSFFGRSVDFFKSNLLDGCTLTVIILMFILPLQWMFFGTVSIVSPISSPLFSLLCTVLLWALPFFFILFPAKSLLSIYSIAIGGSISSICDFAFEFAHLRNIYYSIRYPLAPLFCFLIFICDIFVCILKKKRRFIALGVSLSLCFGFFVYGYAYNASLSDRVCVDLLQDKSSEGIVITTDNRLMVIDVGNGYSGIAKSAVVKMNHHRETEIDVYMLTHYHSAYDSTLSYLFSSQKIRTLLIPENIDSKNLRSIARENAVSIITYIPGERIAIGDATIKTYESIYISRSVQPIVRIDISAFSENFAYLGGAYCEATGEYDFSSFGGVWFGDHGPLYKKAFSVTAGDEAAVFASSSADSYLIDPSRSPSGFILGD